MGKQAVAILMVVFFFSFFFFFFFLKDVLVSKFIYYAFNKARFFKAFSHARKVSRTTF